MPRTVTPAIPTSSVHGECQFAEPPKTFLSEMKPRCHRPNDAGEGEELLLLSTEQWLCLEERDHALQEIRPVPYDEHQAGVRRVPVILLDPSAVEASLDQVEDLTALCALTDMELRYELPTDSRARVPLDGYME